jgi:hypothetical protein
MTRKEGRWRNDGNGDDQSWDLQTESEDANQSSETEDAYPVRLGAILEKQ